MKSFIMTLAHTGTEGWIAGRMRRCLAADILEIDGIFSPCLSLVALPLLNNAKRV